MRVSVQVPVLVSLRNIIKGCCDHGGWCWYGWKLRVAADANTAKRIDAKESLNKSFEV